MIVHDFRHHGVDHGIFERQLLHAFVLGVAGVIFFRVDAAVIVILPVGGAGAAFAHHHGSAGTAEQLGGQKIVVLRLMPGGGLFVLDQLVLYSGKEVLGNDGRDTVGNDDLPVFVLTQELPVVEDRRHKIEVDCLAPHCGYACVVEVVPYLLHRCAVVIAGEHLQHNRSSARVDLVTFFAVDDIAEGWCPAVVFAF